MPTATSVGYAAMDLNRLKKWFHNKQEKAGSLNDSLLDQNLSKRQQKLVKLRSSMNVLTQIATPENLDRVFVPASCWETKSHEPSREDERQGGPAKPGRGKSSRVIETQNRVIIITMILAVLTFQRSHKNPPLNTTIEFQCIFLFIIYSNQNLCSS